MVLIAPSLLACQLGRIGDEIQAIEKAGADVIHFDVMDGHFVPNITFGIPVIASVRSCSKLPFDAHLMISNPDRYLEDFKQAGCNWLSVHVEACPHLNRTLQQIRKLGMSPGVAINPGTSLAALDACLDDVDYVLVMTVNPGFGGQSFIPQSVSRIKILKEMIGDRKVKIQVDGGIKESNIGEVARAGADVMVVGTGFFAAKDYGQQVKLLKEKAR